MIYLEVAPTSLSVYFLIKRFGNRTDIWSLRSMLYLNSFNLTSFRKKTEKLNRMSALMLPKIFEK